MAFSGGMILEVRHGGSDTACGGGFRGGANVATPSAPTVGLAAGGAVAFGTYYVVVTLVDRNGETGKSPETAVTTAGGNQTITVTAPAFPTPGYYNVYVGTVSGGPYYKQSFSNTATLPITVTPPTSLPEAPGVDYSKQNAAQVHIDNSTITATTPGANSNVLTFTAGYTPTSADIGNLVKITAGTNINVDTYEVTDWTSTTWTLLGTQNLTTAGGAGSAITGFMGGALATPGQAATISSKGQSGQNGMFINYNALAYNCSGTSNGPGGKIDSSAINVFCNFVAGYDTTRDIFNTDANKPLIQATANSMTLIKLQDNITTWVTNLTLDANLSTTVTGLNYNSNGGTNGRIWRVTAKNCDQSGFTISSDKATLLVCQALSCGTGYSHTSNHLHLHGCTAISCTTAALCSGTILFCTDCISDGCGAGFTSAGHMICVYCTSYNTTNGSGFIVNASGPTACIINCISDTSTAPTVSYGYFVRGPVDAVINCASRANKTADIPANSTVASIPVVISLFPLTGIPFTNVGAGDFSLNSTAGAGQTCRAAGLPNATAATAYSGLTTNNYADIGAAQHQDNSASPPYIPSQMITQIIVDG